MYNSGLYCSNNPLKNNNLCIKCNQDYYEKENENTANEYKKCYKDPIGYYLDKNVSLYKKCYNSCKTCEISGDNINHNCLECSNEYPLEFKINNNYSNCFQNCNYYYYFEEYNNFHCTPDDVCPKKFPILDGRECKEEIKIPNVEENLIDCFNNEKTIENEAYCYDTVLEQIEDIFTSKSYDISKLDEQDEIIEADKTKITLTTQKIKKRI